MQIRFFRNNIVELIFRVFLMMDTIFGNGDIRFRVLCEHDTIFENNICEKVFWGLQYIYIISTASIKEGGYRTFAIESHCNV